MTNRLHELTRDTTVSETDDCTHLQRIDQLNVSGPHNGKGSRDARGQHAEFSSRGSKV
jgi:hypothetical protein